MGTQPARVSCHRAGLRRTSARCGLHGRRHGVVIRLGFCPAGAGQAAAMRNHHQRRIKVIAMVARAGISAAATSTTGVAGRWRLRQGIAPNV
jgi:hypothetical protein